MKKISVSAAIVALAFVAASAFNAPPPPPTQGRTGDNPDGSPILIPLRSDYYCVSDPKPCK